MSAIKIFDDIELDTSNDDGALGVDIFEATRDALESMLAAFTPTNDRQREAYSEARKVAALLREVGA